MSAFNTSSGFHIFKAISHHFDFAPVAYDPRKVEWFSCCYFIVSNVKKKFKRLAYVLQLYAVKTHPLIA